MAPVSEIWRLRDLHNPAVSSRFPRPSEAKTDGQNVTCDEMDVKVDSATEAHG
jgi:hypothetical protein